MSWWKNWERLRRGMVVTQPWWVYIDCSQLENGFTAIVDVLAITFVTHSFSLSFSLSLLDWSKEHTEACLRCTQRADGYEYHKQREEGDSLDRTPHKLGPGMWTHSGGGRGREREAGMLLCIRVCVALQEELSEYEQRISSKKAELHELVIQVCGMVFSSCLLIICTDSLLYSSSRHHFLHLAWFPRSWWWRTWWGATEIGLGMGTLSPRIRPSAYLSSWSTPTSRRPLIVASPATSEF